jgi:glycosyltransferase involved in cell wall biosynthesis
MSSTANNELISVIIPVYNAEDTITAALDSVKNQTKGKFEIVVVNDGSTDNSLEKIYVFKKQHTELRIIVVDKQHEGVSTTRNMALNVASGNYIAFLDADDEWHDEKTVRQMQVLDDNEVHVVGCLFKPEKNKPAVALQPVTSNDMLYKNFFQTSTVLMKRKVFETTGYFENTLSYGEERRYFLRASQTHSCVLINENLINYGNGKRGFGQSGLSANLLQMEIAELQNLVYAHRVLRLPFLHCCNAIAFSLMKFIRRLGIVYIADRFKPANMEKKY